MAESNNLDETIILAAISGLRDTERRIWALIDIFEFGADEPATLADAAQKLEELRRKLRLRLADLRKIDVSKVSRDCPCGVCMYGDRCTGSPFFDPDRRGWGDTIHPHQRPDGSCRAGNVAVSVPCVWCGKTAIDRAGRGPVMHCLRPTRDGKSAICSSCERDPQIA